MDIYISFNNLLIWVIVIHFHVLINFIRLDPVTCNMSNLIFDEAITRGEVAQLLYNSLELDYETYCQEKFLKMCNFTTTN